MGYTSFNKKKARSRGCHLKLPVRQTCVTLNTFDGNSEVLAVHTFILISSYDHPELLMGWHLHFQAGSESPIVCFNVGGKKFYVVSRRCPYFSSYSKKFCSNLMSLIMNHCCNLFCHNCIYDSERSANSSEFQQLYDIETIDFTPIARNLVNIFTPMNNK